MKQFIMGYTTLYKLLLYRILHVVITKSEVGLIYGWLSPHVSNRIRLNAHDQFVDRLAWFSTPISETEVAMPQRHFLRFKEHVEENAGGTEKVSEADRELLRSLFQPERRTITGAEVLAIRLRRLLGGSNE
jgi:hypothetical protein